jgi:hypothetical protein
MSNAARVAQTNYKSLPIAPGAKGLMSICFLDEDTGKVVNHWHADSAPANIAYIKEWFYVGCAVTPGWWLLEWLTPRTSEDQSTIYINYPVERPLPACNTTRTTSGATGDIFFGFRATGADKDDKDVCLWEHPGPF